MKRFMLLALLVGLLLLTSSFVHAQEPSATGEVAAPAALATAEPAATLAVVAPDGSTTPVIVTTVPEPSSGIDWQTIFMTIFAVIILVDRVTQHGVQKVLASLIDPDKAKLLYESGVRMGLQASLNNAARTPDKADDEQWIQLAKDAGYSATLQPDGTYALIKITSPAAG